MKTHLTLLLSSVLAMGLLACSDQAAQEAPESATQTTVPATRINWEDLMPEGEEEILETLYVEFYEEFERQMTQGSSSLMSAATEEADVSSLVEEGSADDTMGQIGTFNVVQDLNGKQIRVPGYIVPFDFSADATHKEFLLVPYFGACLHTPPPPPNQIILVRSDPAASIPNIYEPVWLEGTLTTGKFLNEVGNSAYELNLSKLEPYDY